MTNQFDIVAEYKAGRRDFQGVNLYGCNLQGANLCCANLQGAYLKAANLCCANLCCANLCCANLCCADLQGADLQGADLQGAYLRGADLQGANLYCANLCCANLEGADLQRALIDEKELKVRQIVGEGDIIGYKKLQGGTVCKLKIPAAAGRVGGVLGRKCRAEYAVVLEGEGASLHDKSFDYKVGETVKPDKWNADMRLECTGGIHFFLTREEAEAY